MDTWGCQGPLLRTYVGSVVSDDKAGLVDMSTNGHMVPARDLSVPPQPAAVGSASSTPVSANKPSKSPFPLNSTSC